VNVCVRALATLILFAVLVIAAPSVAEETCECTCTHAVVRWADWHDYPPLATCIEEGAHHLEWHLDSYCCETDTFLGSNRTSYTCLPAWQNPAGWAPPDGSIYDWSCEMPYCVIGCEPAVISSCDGSDGTEDGGADQRIDSGCADDENNCKSRDKDEFPIRFSSGRIETNPIVLIDATPHEDDELFFGYRLRYGSHQMRYPLAGPTSAPALQFEKQDAQWPGHGFIDNFADRIYRRGSNYVWVGAERFITFAPRSGNLYASSGGSFELTDLGAMASPRFRVDRVQKRGRKHRWTFSKITYQRPPQSAGEFYALSSERIDFDTSGGGGYGYSVERDTAGRVSFATDVLGREIRFTHGIEGAGAHASSRLLSVGVAGGASGGTFDRAYFHHQPDGTLSSIEKADTYYRFNYLEDPPVPCERCTALLTEVIVPTRPYLSTPAAGWGASNGEVIREGHEYFVLPSGTVRARKTYGPGRNWYYVYDSMGSGAVAAQVDLNIPERDAAGAPVTCGAGCGAGYSCWPSSDDGNDRCYASKPIEVDPDSRLITSNGQGTFGYNAAGQPTYNISAAGVRTTYAYDQNGDAFCVVVNDDDLEAAVDPAHPELGCAAPADGSAFAAKIEYGTNSITKSYSSVLSPTHMYSMSRTYNSRGLLTDDTTTGRTRDISGALRLESRTTTNEYDGNGRLIRVDGPLENATANDVTEYEYYDAPDSLDHGRLHVVRAYKSATTFLETRYSAYDARGTARRVQFPNGERLFLSTPAINDWILNRTGAGGMTALSTVHLNPDGTVRATIDADGICTTREYGLSGALTVVKRGNVIDGCGDVPIDRDTGEVQIFTYQALEAERLASVEMKQDGVRRYLADGFTYDRERRLVLQKTPNHTQPLAMGYTSRTLSSVTMPEAPSQGSWKSETAFDELARVEEIARWLSPTSKLVHRLEYSGAFEAMPKRMVRGLDGVTSAVSEYVWDDFGQLIESRTPEHGTVRLEYDAAGRLIKERRGVGTGSELTTRTIFDALGRAITVDRDLEHPVDCATAGEGTLIGDEEYFYDTCANAPSGFSCDLSEGRTAAQIVLQRCTQGQVEKKGRWYRYDGLGRIVEVAHAKILGTVIGAPAIARYSFSTGDRMLTAAPPIDAALSTNYQRASSTGNISAIELADGTVVAEDITYAPFGPVTSFDALALDYDSVFRDDYFVLQRTFRASGNAVFDQHLTYNRSGFVESRRDDADPAADRFYGYDALMRLVCEGTSPADCGSGNEHASHEYLNGRNLTSPPDTRGASVLNTPNYGAFHNNYFYESGTARLETIERGNFAPLIYTYDALGRRTAEVDDSDRTNSERAYTYWPSGRLATVAGKTAVGEKYTIAFDYDTDGRVIALRSPENETELFYDEEDRVTSTRRTRIDGAGAPVERWFYYYLGRALIGARREVEDSSSLEIDNYSVVTDERGLVSALYHQTGTVRYAATFTAAGWRNITGGRKIFIPFALPGQLIVDGTEVAGEGGARPELVLNQNRAYDPLTGTFLQPDPADIYYRTDPEGYTAFRSSPVNIIDPDGARSILNLFLPPYEPTFGTPAGGVPCSPLHQAYLTNLANDAIKEVLSCTSGACGEISNFAAEWAREILSVPIRCGYRENVHLRGLKIDGSGKVVFPGRGTARAFYTPWDHSMTLSPYVIRVVGKGAPWRAHARSCSAAAIAHEALHSLYDRWPASDYVFADPSFNTWKGMMPGPVSAHMNGNQQNEEIKAFRPCFACARAGDYAP
jgi:RHS repeat-associated protein